MNFILHFIIYIVVFCILVKINMYHKNENKCDFSYYSYIFITYTCFYVLNLITIPYVKIEYSYTINLSNIVMFFLIADFLFYWYHICIHRIDPTIKKYIHELHHELDNLVPLDTINNTIIDTIITFFIIYLIPTLIITLNISETILVRSILVLHQFYVHTNTSYKFPIPYFISSKYHERHHRIGGGNYGSIFSLWDNIMGTAIPKKIRKKKKLIKKIKSK